MFRSLNKINKYRSFSTDLHNKLKDDKYSKEFVNSFQQKFLVSSELYDKQTKMYDGSYQQALDSSNNYLSRLIYLNKKWETLPEEFRMKHNQVSYDLSFRRHKVLNNIEIYKNMMNNKIFKENVEKDVNNFVSNE